MCISIYIIKSSAKPISFALTWYCCDRETDRNVDTLTDSRQC